MISSVAGCSSLVFDDDFGFLDDDCDVVIVVLVLVFQESLLRETEKRTVPAIMNRECGCASKTPCSMPTLKFQY